MTADTWKKCPHCGAEYRHETWKGYHFACGTVQWMGLVTQSPECVERCRPKPEHKQRELFE